MHEDSDQEKEGKPVLAAPAVLGEASAEALPPLPLVRCPVCQHYYQAAWDPKARGELVLNGACRCVRRLDVTGTQVVEMALGFGEAVGGPRPRRPALRLVRGGAGQG
ncbi:MAG TPA: hypothetical protein VND93_30870 [Myxococcales bacterium]|nr:hypothetical protein [Myxococcales bacterium]